MACYKSTAKKTVKKSPVKRKTTAKKTVRKTPAKKTYKLTEFGNFLANVKIVHYPLHNRKKQFTTTDLKSGIEVVSEINDAKGRTMKENWRISKKNVKSKYWKIPGNYDAYDEEDAYRTDAEVVSRMNRDLANARRAYAKDPSNPKNSRKDIYVLYWGK